MTTKPLPQDLEAEQRLLGALATDAERARATMNGTTGDVFAMPRHRHVFEAICSLDDAGRYVDVGVIVDRLRDTGMLDSCGGAAGVLEAVGLHLAPPPEAAGQYADILTRLARQRRFVQVAGEAAAAARDGRPDEAAARFAEALEADRSGPVGHDDPDLDALLDSPEPDHDWAIEGLAERSDRIIVTAPEGEGKSTLLRQFGVQVAAGLHPFTLAPIDPLQVLYVDCENSERQARRAFRPLRATAGDAYCAGRLRVRVLGHGIDLADRRISDDLARRIDRHRVDVLIIGPLYKLVAGDPIKEEPARAVSDALDRLRGIRGSVVLMEAHSPYAEGSRAKRPIRPYGASLWSRWPEFGIYLDPDGGAVRHWRGQRDERSWPARLQRSTPWPWAPQEGPSEADEWHGPTECADAIVALLVDLGVELTTNKIGSELRARRLSFRDSTIRDAAAIAHQRGDLTRRNGPRSAWLYTATQPPKAADVLDF